jgi:hypothetical protein
MPAMLPLPKPFFPARALPEDAHEASYFAAALNIVNFSSSIFSAPPYRLLVYILPQCADKCKHLFGPCHPGAKYCTGVKLVLLFNCNYLRKEAVMKKLALILCLALLLGLAACSGADNTTDVSGEDTGTQTDTAEESPTPSFEPTDVTEPDNPTPQPAELEDNVYSGEYDLGQADTGDTGNDTTKPVGHVYISLPTVASETYPQNAALIDDYFENLAAKLREGYEAKIVDISTNPDYPVTADYYYNVGFTSEYNDGTLLSVLITTTEYAGGMHDDVTLRSENFDLSTGTRLAAANLFPDLDGYSAFAKAYIKEQMANNTDGSVYYYDDYESLVDATFDPENFYLTPTGIEAYFQVYDVAPYAAGIISFIIPYEKLSGMLSDTYSLTN